MKNYNLGADWKTVATYTNDGTVTINDPDEYETTITQQGNGIVIAPNGLSNNNSAIHNGLLKVLRDYKHYAQVIVTRETAAGEITASFADDEENMYAYREVTNAELAKATMLVLSDAFYRANNGENLNYELKEGSNGSGFTGSYKIQHDPDATWQISKLYYFYLNDYSPKFPTKAGGDANENNTKLCQTIKVTTSSKVYRKRTTEGSHPQSFDTTTFTVNGVDDYSSIIKDRTVTFVISSADKNECNGTLSCGDFSITLTNGDRKYWLPMALLNQPTWYNNDATYGWW